VLGVNEKSPVDGSKAMLEASPVADRVIGPPTPLGSFAETLKCSVPPTVAFWRPGAMRMGRESDAMTVIATVAWVDVAPSSMMNVTVYVPGATVALGVQLNVPDTGDVP